ncbi:hypothetical protein D3C81_2037240 [compost metagenome]
MLRNALSDSLTVVFLSGTALLVIAALLVLFLKEIPLRSGEKKTEVTAEGKSEGKNLEKSVPAAH